MLIIEYHITIIILRTRKRGINMKKNNEFKSWWIIGILIPFLGLIVYYCNKSMSKETKSNLFTGTIIGFGLWLFLGLSFLIKVNEPPVIEPKEYKVSDWLIDTQKEEPVVTVIGSTACGYCQQYKPILEALAEEYDFNMYFFESDILKYEDAAALEQTYELETYEGRVPFTFIVKEGKIIYEKTGFNDKEQTIELLKQNNIIN